MRVMDWLLFANSKVYLHLHIHQQRELHPVSVHMNYEKRDDKIPAVHNVLTHYQALHQKGLWPKLMREQQQRYPGGRVTLAHRDWRTPDQVWISRGFQDEECPYPSGVGWTDK